MAERVIRHKVLNGGHFEEGDVLPGKGFVFYGSLVFRGGRFRPVLDKIEYAVVVDKDGYALLVCRPIEDHEQSDFPAWYEYFPEAVKL